MITEKEANNLISKLIELKTKYSKEPDPKIKNELKKHEQLCIDKFKYLIHMKTAKYKLFSNYDDLNQEGFEGLVKAIKTYNAKRGNFFSWAHKYIGTKISRSANLHTTIRMPMKVAKKTPPIKETQMPNLIEEFACPDKEAESNELLNAINQVLPLLNEDQTKVINLAYGFTIDKPMSINKICLTLDISRTTCIKLIDSSLEILRQNIKV